MKRMIQACLALLCVLGIITGLISASNIGDRILINSKTETRDNSVANDAIEIIKANLDRKISSGQIQTILPSFNYDIATKLTIGPLLPLFTLYNTARGPEYCDELSLNDFFPQSEISEYGAFIYQSGESAPILFYTFRMKENTWRQSSMSTTSEKTGFGQNMCQYDRLAASHQYSDPAVIWLFNDFALTFNMDGQQVVMPSTKMQHLLGIPNPDDQPQICPVDDFIKRANEAISRFQNERNTGRFIAG